MSYSLIFWHNKQKIELKYILTDHSLSQPNHWIDLHVTKERRTVDVETMQQRQRFNPFFLMIREPNKSSPLDFYPPKFCSHTWHESLAETCPHKAPKHQRPTKDIWQVKTLWICQGYPRYRYTKLTGTTRNANHGRLKTNDGVVFRSIVWWGGDEKL